MIYFTRADWGARYGRGHAKPGPKPWVVAHHTSRPDVACGCGVAEEKKIVRSIEGNHSRPTNEGGQGWNGIAYGHLIFQSGHVYEGRGWGRTGAHTKGRNSTSHGVCFVVDGDAHELTPAAVGAFRELVGIGIGTGEIAPDATLIGHRDAWATACPGDLVYAQLPELWP